MNRHVYSHFEPRGAELFGPGVDPAGRVGRRGMGLGSNSNPIVMACDEAYAMPLSTTLLSLLESNRNNRPLDVFVLTPGFPVITKDRVLRSLPPGSATIHWVPVELSLFKGFSTQPYISTMTYARLLLPYVFSEDVAKVLYLDVDILVLRELDPLWEIDLAGATVGAVVDTSSKDHSRRLQLPEMISRASASNVNSLTHACEYFNAGVLLIDLPRWRQELVSERALQYLVQHPQTLLSDQDALNVVCAGRWKQLDKRWNFQQHDLRGYSRIPVEEWPSIVHFAGKYTKPWLAANLDVNAEFFDAYRSRTQFARKPREKVRDAVLHSWARSKRFLKRYKFISLVYNFLIRPRIADRVSF